ncbi:centrosomal protein of 192 kDa-like [Cylas formicarius]|uniref:centrosomal protein of 192 kDa-like n=1 Tax=Cylas formicarius TaxID=197179 RepID=UPI002958C40D|nr:centrosomal protein of 192 kDa-like [Cylas formicarius]
METNNLSTPKLRARISATSTVDRPKIRKNYVKNEETLLVDKSSANSEVFAYEVSEINLSHDLENQRKLASSSLYRASKFGAIPSPLLRPNLAYTQTNTQIQYDSTINESDLIQTPKNTSTPRSSVINDFKTDSVKFRESIAQFTKMLESNVSIDSVVEEFKKLSSATKIESEITADSEMFMPAEEANSKLLADEMSWKRKHDIPASMNYSSFRESVGVPSISVGEYFQQKSDNISYIQEAISPEKPSKISALVDLSHDLSTNSNTGMVKTKSLSISAIRQLLAETEDSPMKVINYLSNKMKNKSENVITNLDNKLEETVSLPVSKNSSYTSAFSENEALNALETNKENIKPPCTDKTLEDAHQELHLLRLPSRSSSSLTNLPDGKLPIESTKSELVWGCVKVDRYVTKEFLLRNRTSKTIRLQCFLSTYEFKIRKDNRIDAEIPNGYKFLLHGHESRQIMISFTPTKVGGAIDELCFTPLDSNLIQTKKQCIRLFGYGGYTNIEFQNSIKDNTGKLWLSLGRMENKLSLHQTFGIRNSGNLPMFVYIKFIGKHFLTNSNFKVEPSIFVLTPSEEKNIVVSYVPNAKDSKILKQSLSVLPVTDIGRLEIVSGSEVNRARLKRLYRKRVERKLPVDSLSSVLVEKVKGEIVPKDIHKFKESPSALEDILSTFNINEFILTVEQDPNQTLVAEFPEDSAFFQTLCTESTQLLNDTTMSHVSCKLEPPIIFLSPPMKSEDCLYLSSEMTKSATFEAACTPVGLQLTPTTGTMLPGETVLFKIKATNNVPTKHFKVSINVENVVLDADIKIHGVN